jgi:Na+/melibiose symporter-like transporter
LARPDERASLLSAYFVVGYLAFSLPGVLAGLLAPIVGLTTAADFYGIGVILLAVGSLASTMFRRKRNDRHTV